MIVLVACCAALLVAGALIVLVHLRDAVGPGRLARGLRRRGMRRDQMIRLGIGVAGGLVIALITGFVPSLVVVPAMVFILPGLLATPPSPEVKLLEALDTWIRMIVSATSTGRSVLDAIRSTATQVPQVLKEPVRVMLIRLDEHWPVRTAFQGLADDLDSPESDTVCAALIVIIDRGGIGASTTMAALGRQVRDRLHAWREINAEREKPRVVVRQVSLITLVVLGAALIISPGYFAAFTRPLGQVIATALLLGYLGALVGLQRSARPRSRERILTCREVVS